MPTFTWTGTTSTSWGTSTNWTGGSGVPSANDTVIIPSSVVSGHWPTLSTVTSLRTLTVNSGGQLTIASTGSLTTTSSTNASSNAGTITLAGGSLLNTGLFTNNGQISGNGSLGSSSTTTTLTNTSGTITATGGTLSLYSTVNGGTLTIGSGASDNLSVQKTGSSVSNVTFASAAGSGTLTIASGVTLTDTSASALAIGSNTLSLAGTIKLTAGLYTLAGGNITGSGALQTGGGAAASISGYGHVAINIVGGTVTASAGQTLYLDGLVSNSGAAASLVLQNGATLSLTGASVGTASLHPTVDLQGTGDIFIATAAAQTSVHLGTISEFDGTDKIQLKAFGAGDTLSINTVNNTVTISNAAGTSSQTYTFSAGTAVSYIQLSDAGGVDTLTICFMPGTMIRTGTGEVAIETLKPGDLVLTSEGLVKPVNWLGKQTISMRFADPLRNLPIRIKAGALAENVPARDLLISPDHALLVDGVMIHAGALVNGTSITQESNVPEVFIYYHVELDDHSLILAESAPAETFVDNVDRRNFDNWADYEALYPEGKTVEELPYPRAKSARQVPVYIRVALAERAEIIGAVDAAVA